MATFGFHPAIVPSPVQKRNTAGFPGASKKSVWLPLKMVPVGEPFGVFLFVGSEGGIVTTKLCFSPAPLYSVLTPVAWAETHHALPGPRDSPQALISWGSATGVEPEVFETRSVCL